MLKAALLKQHDLAFDVHSTIETVYFPFDAVISLVVTLASGETIETAMVGHDGAVGASAVLNGPVSINKGVVQLSGGCEQCAVNDLRAALAQCPTLRALLGRHEQALFAQAHQSAACNVLHNLENRLAKWLLRARDLSGSEELALTQEYLAQMLGVGRPTPSI